MTRHKHDTGMTDDCCELTRGLTSDSVHIIQHSLSRRPADSYNYVNKSNRRADSDNVMIDDQA